MRIWDIELKYMCNAHLDMMHQNCHIVWSVLTKPNKYLNKHEEILRWKGKLRTLFNRHQEVAEELIQRKLKHKDAEFDLILDEPLAIGDEPVEIWQTEDYQLGLLLIAQCPCPVRAA